MKNLVWFRNDLRVIDHEPLLTAAEEGEPVGLYCFDPRHFENTPYGFPKTDSIRAQFLIESVRELREKLKGRLLVRFGKPEEVIPGLVDKLDIAELYYHEEVTEEETTVERKLQKALDIPMFGFRGHELYHPDDLPVDAEAIPDVFTQFRKKLEKQSSVRDALGKADLKPMDLHVEAGEIPSLSDLGLHEKEPDNRSVLEFKGGESAAWDRLEHYFFEADKLRDYKFTRNGLLGADYSSKFSPWLAHGCISARSIHSEVERYEREVHKNKSTYWLKFELIWRDYFRYSAEKYGSKIFQLGGIQGKELKKENNREWFERWKNGRTGIPFIDANMIELHETGFMSNRGRQNVASFLAQNLDIDWRWGASWFESRLIDYDVCSNWGNWAYNATVGHDPRNRYFNIINQARKYDKKGDYVKRWLPELQGLPGEFIHEPWKMTPDQQALYGVKLGEDYPEPVIGLEESYERIRERD